MLLPLVMVRVKELALNVVFTQMFYVYRRTGWKENLQYNMASRFVCVGCLCSLGCHL